MDQPLAKVTPPERPLGSFALIATVVRNPIEAWPRAVYEAPVYRSVLFGRPTLFVTEPDLVREVLVAQADAFDKAESMRRALRPALGDGILTADGAHWRWQRRATAPIFRHERLLAFGDAMLGAADRALSRLQARSGTEIDLASEMMHTTFDIIVDTMLSSTGDIEVAQVDRDVTHYLESTSWLVAYALLRAPHWLPYPGQRRAERARDDLRAEIMRLVAERRRGGTAWPDLIALLLDARDPDSGRAMDDQEIADNLLTFITAGHETTALALTWTFYLLSHHPAVERRLLDEIETVTGGGALRTEHLEGLAYARQVLQEAMRLYPPAPVIVRAANRDLRLGGEPIAAGTPVYVPVYALHRHVRLWSSPDSFDPDRFAAEPARERHRFAYLPFGAGPRICIGTTFAMLEAVAILATVLRGVRLSTRPGHVPRPKLRITLRPADGMPMQVTAR
ncbi:MAG TPA: cytochrome P450 [Beijerinckiaceae bacterium]|jgi:cytochrome P450